MAQGVAYSISFYRTVCVYYNLSLLPLTDDIEHLVKLLTLVTPRVQEH